MKKVFASDFDGTLYFYKAEVKLPPESVDRIREYQAAGHLFGLCTGRQIGGLTPFITGLVRPDFYITASGASIVDGSFGEIRKQEVDRRIADALVQSSLLPYTFLIVGPVESNSKTREANAILSQRRADAIRDVLVNTFKISTKRLHPIGLGEEQFLDRAKPTSAVNGQLQILTYAKLPEEAPRPAAAPAPAAKKPAKKR